MKRKLIALSRRYEAALQKYLRQVTHPSGAEDRSGAPRARLEAARGLGREAVSIGLETLDMARIHEEAIVGLDGDSRRERAEARGKRAESGGQKSDGGGRRAEVTDQASAFFAEVIHPIEETHVAAKEARVQLGELNETLDRRTAELATSHRRLKQKIVKRKTAQKALRQSGAHQAKLLQESFQLQRHLQGLTRQLLVAQENERGKISRGLRDEIAQTLLGINVRLLALKGGSTVNTIGLKKEIASTEALVARSMKVIHRVARGFQQNPQETIPAARRSGSRSPARRSL